MARIVPWELRVLAPCILISIGAALAEDSQAPNATESLQVSEPQHIALSDSLDVYPIGISPAQDAPRPVATELPTVPGSGYTAVNGLFDANSIAAVAHNSSPSIASENPISSQHVAVIGYVDADSLGNRTVYADGTFAPFSGIYESGIRLRAMVDAS